MKPNWLVTQGSAQLKKDEIKFIPIEADGDVDEENKVLPWSIIRSDLYFQSGEINISNNWGQSDICLLPKMIDQCCSDPNYYT